MCRDVAMVAVENLFVVKKTIVPLNLHPSFAFLISDHQLLFLSKKKRQFSIYKTCFDILMSSSVANELFNGCTFEFMLRYVAKLHVRTCVQFKYEV